MIKKFTAFLLVLLLSAGLFSACSDTPSEDGELNIVCTVFPYYDWVKNITGDSENINITLLLDSGTDLHSYQPSAADIITISSADIFIFTGGTSDSWVEDALATSKNEETVVLEMMKNLPEDSLFCVEAIGEEEHIHEGEEHIHEGEEHNHHNDEHIWLSIKNAVKLSEIIKNVIQDKDPGNKDKYQENFDVFRKKLDSLDKSFTEEIGKCSKDTVIFADRFPFIYLMNDYGLRYAAAFSGCSAESEASFETVTRLAEKTDELGLSYIVITETADGSIAETVRNATKNKNQEILTLNAMQSVTKDKLGISYIEIMEENLKVITTALS